ncbi:hypothetical protein PFISCL1PPCAC_9085, partial [Pristionchus fissidentatus]
LAVIFVLLNFSIDAKLQGVSVTGTLSCNKYRQRNQKVELMERDVGLVDPDDLLAEVHSDHEGEFKLTGATFEIGKIEPYIRVTHNCAAKPGCTRVTEFDIPKEYINGTTYVMDYVVLDIVQKRDKETCK